MDFEPVAWSHPLYIKSPMFSPHHWISDLLSLLKLTIYLQWFCKWMSNWGGIPLSDRSFKKYKSPLQLETKKMQTCKSTKQTFYSIKLLKTNEKTNQINKTSELIIKLFNYKKVGNVFNWLALQNDNAMFT